MRSCYARRRPRTTSRQLRGVKLLFDENLSHTLVGILDHEFPACAHVRNTGLRAAEDGKIWDHARTNGFVIISKDTDFRERSYVEGFPPKIIWLDATPHRCAGRKAGRSSRP